MNDITALAEQVAKLTTKLDKLHVTMNTLVDIVNAHSIKTCTAHNRIDELTIALLKERGEI
jgi:outer membrane murein-binding lipoprotein Lpp